MNKRVHKSKYSQGAVSIVCTSMCSDVGIMHEPSVPIACLIPSNYSPMCGTFISTCNCAVARLNICLTDDGWKAHRMQQIWICRYTPTQRTQVWRTCVLKPGKILMNSLIVYWRSSFKTQKPWDSWEMDRAEWLSRCRELNITSFSNSVYCGGFTKCSNGLLFLLLFCLFLTLWFMVSIPIPNSPECLII